MNSMNNLIIDDYPERFWIKRSPELIEVLNLSGDLYSVIPNELVRKAIDEFMIGMQFYVLFTLSHSAIISPSNQRISFKYNTTSRIKNIACKETREIIMPQPFEMEMFKKQVEIFIKSAATKDLTCLLNHIKEVSKTDIGREYYNEKIVDTLNELSKCARYFYHRNYFVVESPDQSIFKSIAENQMAVAKIFFDNNFFDDLPHESPDSYNSCTAWEKNICKKLKEAAFDHFKNARNIQKLFKYIFKETAQNDGILDVLGKLNEIKETKTDETKDIHQFVVFALWTRFGSIWVDLSEQEEISESVTENDDDLGAFITKKTKKKTQQHLKVECIVRHEITLENNDLITTKRAFNADPIGITHLDVINLAIDITLLALRRILHKALTQPNEPGLRDNIRSNRNRLLSSLLEMTNKNIIVKENFPKSNLYFFKEEEVKDEIRIVDDFNQRCGYDSSNVSHFINSSAHFAFRRSSVHR
jgi:hypothetical protein